MTILRYSWNSGFTEDQLLGQIPGGLTVIISGISPTLLDIELLPDPVSADAKTDLDECLVANGWVFVEENPNDTITEVVIVQDFDSLLAVDVSTTATAPAWGDLFVIPLVVGGDGFHDVKVSTTLTANGSGATGAVVRVVLRDGGGDIAIGIPGRVVSGGGQPVGNTAMNGRRSEVTAGNYDVVVQGRISTGSLAINASSNPVTQGLNVNIQEVYKSG